LINPQPVELVNSINPNVNDFVYRILPSEVYLKPNTYSHAPFPTKKVTQNYVSTAGYVTPEDIEIRLDSKDQIPTVDINTLEDGYYFWIAKDGVSWNVYRFTAFENTVREVSINGDLLRITLNRVLDTDLSVGDYIGINNSISAVEGFKPIINIGINYFEIPKPATVNTSTNISLTLNLFKFISVKIPSFEGVNSLGIPKKKPGDLIWVDGVDNDWSVWKYERSYSEKTFVIDSPYYGKTISVDKADTVLAVSALNSIFYYDRPSSKADWSFKSEIVPVSTQGAIVPNLNLLVTNNTFGKATAISDDGQYLAVGVPGGSITSGAITNQGYVVLYVKNINGYFDFSNVITSATSRTIFSNNEFFGHSVGFIGNKLVVASKGSSSVAPTVTAFNILTLTGSALDLGFTSFDARVDVPVNLSQPMGTEIVSMSVANNGNVVISFSNNKVKIWNFSATASFNRLVQDITYTTTKPLKPSLATLWLDSTVTPSVLRIYNGTDWAVAGNSFASSVALSKDGSKLAIGDLTYSNTHPDPKNIGSCHLVNVQRFHLGYHII
jgi:hypothetical protein